MTATRRAAVVAGSLVLAACVSATGGKGVASASGLGAVRVPAATSGRAATVHMAPGLEDVIGATPAELTRRFGAPRLDVLEGDARKLQFSASACVLDVYLYPGKRGAEPEATYVDARRASDGQDVDRAACVAALRRPG